MSAALLAALSGCGSGSDPSPPTGVDELIIPTPSPRPSDFVDTIDNPLLALVADNVVTVFEVTGDVDGSTRSFFSEAGPDIDGIVTTAVHQQDQVGDVSGGDAAVVDVAIDYYAQDIRGNVWWFGREGEWEAGVDGAEAGLFMAAHPRFGDGYRSAPGLVAEVAAVDSTVEGPSGSYDDVVVIDTTDAEGRVERSYYAGGVGLVHQETTVGVSTVVLDLVARPQG